MAHAEAAERLAPVAASGRQAAATSGGVRARGGLRYGKRAGTNTGPDKVEGGEAGWALYSLSVLSNVSIYYRCQCLHLAANSYHPD